MSCLVALDMAALRRVAECQDTEGMIINFFFLVGQLDCSGCLKFSMLMWVLKRYKVIAVDE